MDIVYCLTMYACVHVHIYIYTIIYVCLCVCVHACVCVDVCIWVHACVRAQVHIHVVHGNVHACACVCACVHVCVCVCVCVCLSRQYTQHNSSEVLNPPCTDGGLQIHGVVPNVGVVIQEVQGAELRTPACHVHLGHWPSETAAVTIRFEALLNVFDVGILGEKDQSDGLSEWPWEKRIKVAFHQANKEWDVRSSTCTISVEVHPHTELVSVTRCVKRSRVQWDGLAQHGISASSGEIWDLPDVHTPVAGGLHGLHRQS